MHFLSILAVSAAIPEPGRVTALVETKAAPNLRGLVFPIDKLQLLL